MRFEKTTGDLMIVNGVSPRDIGLYEVFNVMLDVLLDVRSETGQELYSLNVDEQAVAKWIAVANALLSVPVESADCLLPWRLCLSLSDTILGDWRRSVRR